MPLLVVAIFIVSSLLERRDTRDISKEKPGEKRAGSG